MPYTSPGTLGPTADYPGDSSDYSGSSGSFDWGGFADSIVSIIPGVLTGSAALYNATHNQQGQVVPYGSQYAINPYAAQQQQLAQNNTALYIGGAVVLLLIVIVIIFLLTRKKS